jgi:MFS transporter, PAT family, beta-lactamase induction signal transducer AmpG
MLLKMAQPFFLDARIKGGLGLSLLDVGFIYGNIGMICLLFGGIAGSWLVFKYGLKRCLMPTAIAQSLTLLLYWLLAIYKPALSGVALANAFEQFVYGLASTAYTSYLFTIVKDKFLTSHYAIATGFMAVGIMLPGAISGYLADGLGYQQFFLISFFCSLPGIFFTSKLPFTTYNEASKN